jgi:hypothetical protein
MTSKAALLFALCACSAPTPSAPSRARASTPRAPATPEPETIELPLASTGAPARVVLHRAVAPARGVVFYGGLVSDDHREHILQRLAPRSPA